MAVIFLVHIWPPGLASKMLMFFRTAVVHSCRFNSSYWIGLMKNECVSEGSTYWMDGSTSDFRNWAAGQPNEDVCCTMMSHAFIMDRNCSENGSYICNKDASMYAVCVRMHERGQCVHLAYILRSKGVKTFRNEFASDISACMRYY